MHINLDTEILGLDGENVPFVKGKVSTIRSISSYALMQTLPGDENVSGQIKYERFCLARKIKEAEENLELTAEEIVTIKEYIGKAFGPGMVGPSYDTLESATQKKPELVKEKG